MATMNGMKIVLMRKWIPEEGVCLSLRHKTRGLELYLLKYYRCQVSNLRAARRVIANVCLVSSERRTFVWREGQLIYAPANLRLTRSSVPAMVSDLMDSSLAGYSLEGLFFGGSPAPDVLTTRAKQVFPKAQLCVALTYDPRTEVLRMPLEARVMG